MPSLLVGYLAVKPASERKMKRNQEKELSELRKAQTFYYRNKNNHMYVYIFQKVEI